MLLLKIALSFILDLSLRLDGQLFRVVDLVSHAVRGVMAFSYTVDSEALYVFCCTRQRVDKYGVNYD